jgi:hypothetical protein
MRLYALLYESMMDFCDGLGCRFGLTYTVAMAALGLGLCFNLLSVVDLLWTLRVLDNPYSRDGTVQPRHYVFALLYGGVLANTIAARIKFAADRRCLSLLPEIQAPQAAPQPVPSVRMPGPAYLLGSAVVFFLSLTAGLLLHR